MSCTRLRGWTQGTASALNPVQTVGTQKPLVLHGLAVARRRAENFADEAERDEAASGCAAVLSNLKSLIETGSPLPQ